MHLLPYVEIAGTLAVFGLIRRPIVRQRLRGLSVLLARSSRHPNWTVLGAGLVGLLVSIAACGVRGIPIPVIHDEFCYLLAGDTFARGRLANPPHPFWQHFETMHVIQQPTYMPKYPPGQGLALAAGEYLANLPILGVWLSVALASAAIAWMLLAWLPPRWAVLGAFCAALRLAGGPWAHTYWGGAVAAMGGALLFGSVRRLADRPDWRPAVLLGLGLAILANSRPFEGLLAALTAAVILLIAWWRSGAIRHWSTWSLTALPVAIVLAPVFSAMADYNRAVTGSALRLPYELHDAIYAACPLFICQPLHQAPQYRHHDMEQYWAHWVFDHYLRKRVWLGLNASNVTSLWIFAGFFIGPALALPFFALTRMRARFWMVAAWSSVGVLLLAMSQSVFLLPHYLAPLTGLIWFLAIQGARALGTWRLRGLRQRNLAWGLLLMAGIGPVFDGLVRPRASHRSFVTAHVAAQPGKHLILVHLRPDFNIHESWIYNSADIDSSPIVWARSLGDDEDAKLLDYFHDRQPWQLFVDSRQVALGLIQRTRSAPEHHVPMADGTRPVEERPGRIADGRSDRSATSSF
jgi:hypothetical protein